MAQRRVRIVKPRPAMATAGGQVPFFDLPSSTGGRVSLWDYKGRRNLVLFFAPRAGATACQHTLRAFAARYQDYRERACEVLAVVHGAVDEATRLSARLALPFPVLADEGGDVQLRYAALIGAARTDAAIFISDRFGQIWAHSTANGCHDLYTQDEILGWLDFIEIQCPE